MTTATRSPRQPVGSRPRRSMKPLVRQLAVLITVPVCFAFAAGSRDLLPYKYFADSEHIQSLGMAASGPAADSFTTMAWLYRLAGAFDYPTVTYMATLGLFFVVVFRCVRLADISRIGWPETILFIFCGVEASIYLAQFSKESVIVLLVLLLVVVPERVSGDLTFALFACCYAYLIRSYWFVVVGLYIGFRLVLRCERSRWLPIFVACSLVALAYGTKLAMGVDLGSFRAAVNESNALYAQSAIQDYLPIAGPIGAAANAILTQLLLIVPIPLVVALSPTYLVFSAVISALWLRVLQVARTGTRLGWFRVDTRLSRAVSLLLAMLTVQAVFEPDYGSYIKHLTPLLPLFFLVLRATREHRQSRDPTGRPVHETDGTPTHRDHSEHPTTATPGPQTSMHVRQKGPRAMTLSAVIRALLHKWYLALPCIALSCGLAALTFTLAPPHYTSSGLAMVVQPKRAGLPRDANPLLSMQTSLNTTAVMLSQSLSTPQSAASLGVGTGTNKYTVKNIGDTNTGGDPNQPFLFISTQGTTPEASTDLVQSVLALAEQQLADQQRSLHVARQDALTLATIDEGSTPKLAPGLTLAASGAVLCLCLGLIVLACVALDRDPRVAARSHPAPVRDGLTPGGVAALALGQGQPSLTAGSNGAAHSS
jgi:hypothetical protein